MVVINLLAKRYYCDNYHCYFNSWDSWIRWTVLAIAVAFFFILFFTCSCRNARRRRRAGQQPLYGTGWTAPAPRYESHQTNAPYYNNNTTATYPPAPPQYSQDVPTGHSGYYGQQSGIELQPPPQAYTVGREGDVYEPPVGPPPAKSLK
ncbi:hypothetical protein E2P81_ATG11438 [Venturia nashicola]|uniref:Uncharacterized protein n=1 Tax=Venturia nashicola TaxID=86259 RepID=A0A4Z1PBC9_9PEZI|nr:hypothetical protein E6O75_ATG11130 [Venturia nashicola]TLD35319.1 hypothetical protein E2P81_ATG11438 [Venturia nashicola]